MIQYKALHKLRVILILAGTLSGCAAYDKCKSGGCSRDAQITTNVQARFQQHPDLGPPNSISVQTLDHVVYLSGEVSAGELSSAAESVAHEVPGVTRVVNSIAVTH
jgi:osmotically-inducible protein OsmY